MLAAAFGGAAPASAVSIDGTPSTGEVVLFHPSNDYRRPLFAAIRSPSAGFGPRLKLAGPGSCCAVLDVNAAGDAVAAWHVGPGVWAALRPAGRSSFGRAKLLGRTDETTPRVVVSASGDAVVAWQDGSTVVAAVRTRRDADFGKAQRLGQVSDVGLAELRLVGNGRGHALALWLGPRERWLAAVREPRGRFGRARATPVRGHLLDVYVALDDDGRATLLWPVPRALNWSRSLPDGRWRTARPVLAPRASTSVGEFMVGFGRGGATVYWSEQGRDGRADDRTWRGAEIAAGDAGFHAVEPPFPRTAYCPQLAVGPTGHMAATYGTEWSVIAPSRPVFMATRPPGGAWVPPEELQGFEGGCGVRSVVDANGAAAAVQAIPTGFTVAAYKPPGRPVATTTLGETPPYLQVGVVIGDGRATAAWEHSDGATIRALARDFDATGPGDLLAAGSQSVVRIGPASACRPPNAITLDRNRVAHLFMTRTRYKTTFWGCMFRRGGPTRMIEVFRADERSALPIALGGRYVGLVGHPPCDEVDCEEGEFPVIYDLLGDTTSRITTDAPKDDDVTSIVLNARAGIAWIQCTGRSCSVYGRHSTEPEASRLANGDRIAPRSLRLSGTMLSWREGDRLRSTSLR